MIFFNLDTVQYHGTKFQLDFLNYIHCVFFVAITLGYTCLAVTYPRNTLYPRSLNLIQEGKSREIRGSPGASPFVICRDLSGAEEGFLEKTK